MLSITTQDTSAYGSHSVNPDKIYPSTSQDSPETHRKKKKKRNRDDDSPADPPAADEHHREKKKKRKHQDQPQDTVDDNVEASVPTVDASSGSVLKPKKKKKDKGKEKADMSMAEPTDAQIEADSQASAAALLSAIVAASVTAPENSQMGNQHMQFHQNLMQPPPGQHFMQYPPMQYGYPPGAFDTNLPQSGNMFGPPGGGGGAFSELAFGSNDDLLRALQDLDMSKLANALKTFGDANPQPANNSAFAPHLGFMPTPMEQAPPPTNTRPPSAPSTAHRAAPARPKPVYNSVNMAMQGRSTPSEHAHILANKWLTASKLTELVNTEGLVYKKGKFSAIEESQVRDAIEKYQNERGLTSEQIIDIIFTKNDQAKDSAFWSEITTAVPLRPIIAVYHYVRRKFHPMRSQGAWSAIEDNKLKQAVADLGQQWEKICYRVGRMASDCRDRYRNHIVDRDTRLTGHWSKEEEDKLTEIVTNMTIKQGRDPDNDVFWGKVSELMGGSRGRQQCRIKWTDALSKTVKNKGEKPRWSPQDAFILVHKIDSLQVRDDSEIDWKMLSDPDWNLWSPHTMQRRWLTLKRSVKGWEEMTHAEIMDILRIKKAHLPPPAPVNPKKPKKKFLSAETVEESNLQGSPVSTPTAGSSTGVGTPGASSQ